MTVEFREDDASIGLEKYFQVFTFKQSIFGKKSRDFSAGLGIRILQKTIKSHTEYFVFQNICKVSNTASKLF